MTRKTRQRDAIRSVFQRTARPLGPQEVLSEAQAEVPGLGIATVYRTIKSLVEEGLLIPIDVPGQPTCYEQSEMEHHHHFHCKKCDRVFDVEGCLAGISQLCPPGFRVDSHEIFLYGRCPQCP
jgi:Fur family transcriptional regulator, ferric uptake regulator